MNNISRLLVYVFVLLVTSCVSVSTSKTSKNKSYSEDLTSYLPSDPVDTLVTDDNLNEALATTDSTLDIRERLDSALLIVDTFTSHNKSYIEGLALQLYAGNDRSEAKETQMRAFRYFPESKPKIIFDQPNYKVRMGNFYTQLEAYPMFRSVQAKFPKAILVPIRIPIKNN